MFDKFKLFAPAVVLEKGYASRKPKSFASKCDAGAAEIQNFRASRRFIRAANPIGVIEHEILSLAIAKHLGKRHGMSYEARNYPHS